MVAGDIPAMRAQAAFSLTGVVSARIREELDVPVFLAGGLTPGNAAEAVATVGPYGLDVCGGVRRNGRPDAGLVDSFMTEVRQTA